MGNAILKKVLAFALSLTLIITMAPIIPGAAAKASASELLSAPTITIDENGVATCTDVGGAAEYAWEVSRAGSILDPGESYDVYNTLVDLGEDSGQHEVRVYAMDVDRNTISKTGAITYDFTSPHTHVWDYEKWEYDGDYGDEYHWHPCTAENCLTPNCYKEGAAKHEYFNGVCVTCGKERVLLPAPTITIDENGIATWSAVDGANEYYYEMSNFGGYISLSEFGDGVNLPDELAYYSKGPGYYTFSIYAVDSNRQVISETAKANYDARTIADTFVASSSFKAPVYGESVTDVYDFTFTSEVNAEVPDSMGDWYKKVDGEWEGYEGTVFTDGTYRYSNQLRLDSASGTGSTYRLPKDKALDITINGEKWTGDEYVSVWPTYSYVYMYSPEYVVEKTALDLAFGDSASFDIKNVYQNRAIETKSVKDAVIGGEEPYVFSKTSGPDWLNVSSDGTISGTPDVIGGNDDLVVRVTDNKGDFKEITIDVANTLMNPNDRTIADTFVASSSFKAPALGESVTDVYDFTFTSEVNADVPDSMGNWYKKVGEEWVEYTASTFGVGDYYFSNQLRLDKYSGTGSTHRLPEDGSTISVTINGEKWTVDQDVWVDDAYSYVYMDSPVYEVRKELPEVTISTTSYTYDGTAKTPEVTVEGLEKDVDYKVTYSNNTNAGTGKVIVEGIGNYGGTITKNFTIAKQSSSKCKASLSTVNYTYNGKAKTPSVTVKNAAGATLKNGTDYTVSYASGRAKIGRYKVTVNFKGNYTGSTALYFMVGPKNTSSVKTALYGYDDVKITWKKVSGVSGYKVYYKTSTSGYKLLKTTKSTSYKKKNLSDGVKYTFKVVAYKKAGGYNCENAGKTSSIYTLKKIAGVKAVKSGSKVKVSWTNISGETGYQISQSTSKSKTKIVSTYKTTSGKSKNISAKKGKTYYYKVRTYKTVSGKKIYGPWSTAVKYKR